MSRCASLSLLLFLPLWLAASYGLRFALMEDGQWVGTCSLEPERWECQLRATLGLVIHWGALAWTALIAALIAFFVPGRAGAMLAVAGLAFGLPAVVLYTASLGVLAVVIAGLRLVRRAR